MAHATIMVIKTSPMTIAKRYFFKNPKKCSKCMECIEKCPTKNIKFENKKIAFSDKCTMCYRCINICPRKAITFLGKEIEDQSRIEMYIDETK